MTRKRNDEHSTEFGLWLRKQNELHSKTKGYAATNLDYIWNNYNSGEWMLIEEKRYGSICTYSQKTLFKKIHKAIINGKKKSPNDKYKGIHLIVFEKTSPEDGKIFLNHKEITKEQLMSFLKFKR